MRFKLGYTVKPSRIQENNVIFTDGTNEMTVSQVTCEAYGYKWNQETGTCQINRTSKVNLEVLHKKKSNILGGNNNKIGGSVLNTASYGENNRFEGDNKNIIINGQDNLVKYKAENSVILSGSSNIIGNNVNNSSILSGIGAISNRDNETVMGGYENDGANRFCTGIPYTAQVSQFVMQTTMDDNISYDLLHNGANNIKLQKNSKVHLTARVSYMAAADGGISSRTTQCHFMVNDSGEIKGLQQTHHIQYTPSILAVNHAFVIDTNTLRLRGIGDRFVWVVAVADIRMTEVLFKSDTQVCL
tara:strand:- start:141 stop:1043 length:903 start_codon:yes stop_codon:yes gene_type:complete